jgi:SAM-dependent methyltransferase
MNQHEWVPVAPTWERNPDDKELWRRVPVMPSLALNTVEMEALGPVAGRAVCVFGVGDGMAALALGALGARVTVVDPVQSLLDMILVRGQIIGVQLTYIQSELCELAGTRDDTFSFAYAAQVCQRIEDLNRFYAEIARILLPGGRLIVNQYHPFRRIWKQEPGHPQIQTSYFERRRAREEEDDLAGDPTAPDAGFGRFDYNWTISDHFRALSAAGLYVSAIEEVGDVRQKWEIPTLKGLPEQLLLVADKPWPSPQPSTP